MKKWFLLFVLAINVFCITQIKAELFDGSIHFYIKSGESLNANTKIDIRYFDKYNKRIGYIGINKAVISQNLQKDRNFYSSQNNSWAWQNSYKEQPSISTSMRDVFGGRSYTERPYTGPWYPGCPFYETIADNYSFYWGFAKDKSSYIWWKEDLDGNLLDKKYYMEVSIEDLMPKNVNRDFLNE